MVFRMTSLEILKGLSIGGNSGNSHFVRCVRPTLDYKPRAFHVSPIKWLYENSAAHMQSVINLGFYCNFTERYGLSANTRFGHSWYRCVTAKGIPSTYLLHRVPQEVNSIEFFLNIDIRNKNGKKINFRYKFLAFEFDENVDMTKDNCRLLLIRLKMEGWAIGRSKVFLKYYNVEYLSR